MNKAIGHNSVTKALGPEDTKKLRAAMKEMEDSYTRTQAERDLQKSIIDRMYEEVGVSKKLFRKLAKAFYRSEFDMIVEENRDFESTYETITGA